MFCNRCGNELPNDALFCNVCGTRTFLNEQELPSPPPLGRVTVQFGDGTPITQPPFSSPQYPPTVYGDGLSTPPEVNSGPYYPQNLQYPPPTWRVPTSPLAQGGLTSAPANQQSMTLSAVQQFLLRVFGVNLATNALFGVVMGGIIAAVVGVLASALFLSIAHGIAPHITNGANFSSGEQSIDYALGISSLHNLFRDALQLFLVMHGVGIHIQYGYGTYSYFGPLHGLLILPALLLTLAGYIAASTDFQNRVQTSLWLGVSVALPYTALLFLFASQVNGCIPTSGPGNNDVICSLPPSSSTGLLNMDTLTILIFGLLWGTLFGLLGASLKVARGQWRHMIHRYLQTTSRPQVMGMLVGGLAASGLGIALSLLVLVSFIAYTSYSLPLLYQSLCFPSASWQPLALWSIAQGPLHAVNLFFLSFGAPINISNPSQSVCFYARSVQTSISLFGSNPQLSPWTHLLLALPVISLFLGGRVSAAIGRVQGSGAGAIQGALIALPFTVLMVFLALISSITSSFTSSGGTTTITSSVQSAGASIFELILWALLSGAVVGALGGIYQTSRLKAGAGQFLFALTYPFIMLCRPGYVLLDRLTRQTGTFQQSRVRYLLYTAFLYTLLLAIAAGVVGGILIIFNQTLSYDANIHIRDILSVVLIALPGLLLLYVCGSALCRDSLMGGKSYTPTASLRASAFQ